MNYWLHWKFKNKQCKWIEYCVGLHLLNLKQLCSKESTIQKQLCCHNTFCLVFNFVHGYLSLAWQYVKACWKGEGIQTYLFEKQNFLEKISSDLATLDSLQAYFNFIVKFTKTFISDLSSQFILRSHNYNSQPHLGSRPIVWEAMV